MSIKTVSHFEDISFYISRELRSASESIKICVAWINWGFYNKIFDEALKKGVSVEILYNEDVINNRHFIQPNADVSLFPVKGRWYNSLMHNKFCIIDDRIVLTGSFNWSKSAYFHFENIVIIEDDFKLVKNFLHEFEDLKQYFYGFPHQRKLQCRFDDGTQCKLESYNIGIFGQESGLYDESLIDIWNICFRHGHVSFVREEHESHLQSYLGLKDPPDWDGSGESYDKYTMLSEFKRERNQIQMIQDYFKRHQGVKVHAIGVVEIDNFNEHHKWGEEPDYVIKVLWRDMYYRKLIPDVLYSGSYDIDHILNRHA